MQSLTYIIGKDNRNLVNDIQDFKIDFNDSKFNWVQARQYEDGMRQVFVTMKNEDNTPFDLTGCNYWFEGILPDKTHRILDAKHGVPIDPVNGQFRFDMPKQAFAVAGSYVQAFFRIMKDGASITTLEFDLQVLADKVISGLIPADYNTPFEDLYGQLTVILKKAGDDVAAAIVAYEAKVKETLDTLNQLSDINTAKLKELADAVTAIQAKVDAGDVITASQLKEQLQAVTNEFAKQLASAVHLIDVNRMLGRQALTDKIGIENAANVNLQAFQYLADVGFKYCRVMTIFQNDADPDGSYHWDDNDGFINNCLQAGMTPVVTVGANEGLKGGSYDESLLRLKQYVVQLVQRYAGKGVVWEGFNESFYKWLDQAMDYDPQDMVTVTNILGKAIRQYDSQALFIAGAFSSNADYISDKDEYLNWGRYMESSFNVGLLTYANALSHHPYQVNTKPEALLAGQFDAFNKAIKRTDLLLDQYANGRVPQVVTEFGYSTSNGNTGARVLSEDEQANWVGRSVFVFDMLNIPMFILYRDVGAKVGTAEEKGVTSDAKIEYGFGLFQSTGGTDAYRGLTITGDRPAGALVRKLISNLKGYVYQYRLSTTSTDDYVLVYKHPDNGQVKLVYWNADTSNVNLTVSNKQLSLTPTPQVIDVDAEPSSYLAQRHDSQLYMGKRVVQKLIPVWIDSNQNQIANGDIVLNIFDFIDYMKVEIKGYFTGMLPNAAGSLLNQLFPKPEGDVNIPVDLVDTPLQQHVKHAMIRTDGMLLTNDTTAAEDAYDAKTVFDFNVQYTSIEAVDNWKKYL